MTRYKYTPFFESERKCLPLRSNNTESMAGKKRSDKKTRAERVDAMSLAYEKAGNVIRSLSEDLEAFDGIRDDVAKLEEYQSSGLWLEDFEADEAGALPEWTLRAVLSEDGLYDLLRDYDAILRRLRGPESD